MQLGAGSVTPGRRSRRSASGRPAARPPAARPARPAPARRRRTPGPGRSPRSQPYGRRTSAPGARLAGRPVTAVNSAFRPASAAASRSGSPAAAATSSRAARSRSNPAGGPGRGPGRRRSRRSAGEHPLGARAVRQVRRPRCSSPRSTSRSSSRYAVVGAAHPAAVGAQPPATSSTAGVRPSQAASSRASSGGQPIGGCSGRAAGARRRRGAVAAPGPTTGAPRGRRRAGRRTPISAHASKCTSPLGRPGPGPGRAGRPRWRRDRTRPSRPARRSRSSRPCRSSAASSAAGPTRACGGGRCGPPGRSRSSPSNATSMSGFCQVTASRNSGSAAISPASQPRTRQRGDRGPCRTPVRRALPGEHARRRRPPHRGGEPVEPGGGEAGAAQHHVPPHRPAGVAQGDQMADRVASPAGRPRSATAAR